MRKPSAFDKLSKDEKKETIDRLLLRQAGKSYISDKAIELAINKVEVDHIVALDRNGPDNESNWGIVIDTENSSKGTRDLQLMRYLYTFRRHSEKYLKEKRDFNLGDALNEFFPNRVNVSAKYNDERTQVTINFIESKENRVIEFPMLVDSIDKVTKSFVGMIPFSIVNHDATINPRSIVDLEPLIEEFYNNNPQLFPSLAILEVDVNGKGTVNIFDGQHKAAAQLYNRGQNLFLRVFVNVEKAKIKRTNLRAHTIVAQIHFPQLITDKVGHDLFKIEFEPYIDKTSSVVSCVCRGVETSDAWFSISIVRPNTDYITFIREYYQSCSFRVCCVVNRIPSCPTV